MGRGYSQGPGLKRGPVLPLSGETALFQETWAQDSTGHSWRRRGGLPMGTQGEVTRPWPGAVSWGTPYPSVQRAWPDALRPVSPGA